MHCAHKQEMSPQAGAMHCAPTICIAFHPKGASSLLLLTIIALRFIITVTYFTLRLLDE